LGKGPLNHFAKDRSERYLLAIEGNQTVIANGDTMSVATEATEDLCWSSECRLGVNHPLLSEESAEVRREGFRILKVRRGSTERELMASISSSKSIHKLSSKDTTEYSDGKKEVISGMNPMLMVRGEASCRHQAVSMRMQSQVLSPGMQNGEEADLCSKVFRIGSYFEHGLRHRAKQQVIEQLGVVSTKWIEQMRNGEDNVEVGQSEQFFFTTLKPALARLSLTFWTVPVTA
jgi:hypothetical protein